MRHAEQVADDLDRNGGRERLDQIDRLAGFGLRLHRVEQVIDQHDEAVLHRRNVLRRQRAADQAAHAGVQRRIVEREAGRVVLEQR